jgi:hypothetical protein
VGAGVGRQGLTRVGTHGVGVVVGLGVGVDVASGTEDAVGCTTARVVAGLSNSATSPARRTVAAMAPRRAALIGRTAAAEGV